MATTYDEDLNQEQGYGVRRPPRDAAVFGVFPQVAGRTKYARKMDAGVQAQEGGGFGVADPSIPAAQVGLPAGVQPSTVQGGRGVINPPLATAPAPAAVNPALGARPVAVNAGTSTAGAGRGSVNPPEVNADARPDLANVPNVNGNVGLGVEGAPGVRKIVGADGKVTYTNVAGNNPKGYGVSTIGGGQEGMQRNLRAAEIYAGINAGQNTAPLAGAVIPGVNAPVSQYDTETAQRNASVVSNFANVGKSRADMRAAEIAANKEIAAAHDATALATNAATVGATREGHQLAADTARYGVNVGAQTAANKLAVEAPAQLAQTQLAIQNMQARVDLVDAMSSGDPKRIAKAENTLRALQGKYEKDQQPVRHLVVQGGTIPDPNNVGGYIHQPSVVFDPDTKTFMAPPAQPLPAAGLGAGAMKPTPKSDYDKLPRGARYIGPDGKPYYKE